MPTTVAARAMAARVTRRYDHHPDARAAQARCQARVVDTPGVLDAWELPLAQSWYGQGATCAVPAQIDADNDGQLSLTELAHALDTALVSPSAQVRAAAEVVVVTMDRIEVLDRNIAQASAAGAILRIIGIVLASLAVIGGVLGAIFVGPALIVAGALVLVAGAGLIWDQTNPGFFLARRGQEEACEQIEAQGQAWSEIDAAMTPETPIDPVSPVGIDEVATENGWQAASWQRQLLEAADRAATTPDRRTSARELDAFYRSAAAVSLRRPEQAYAVVRSELAERTRERDLVRSADACASGRELVAEYMRVCYDDTRRIPLTVTHVLAASDMTEHPARKDAFRADPLLPEGARATLGDYLNSGFDRGHLKPAEDSPNDSAMRESFLLSNMSPQVPSVNQQAWRRLESAVNELVEASGGRAVILTGNLFLDEHERPLAAERFQWIGEQGAQRVAIPTHLFKCALITLPRGEISLVSFVVPNHRSVPTKLNEIRPYLHAARRSVDFIEERLGANLFADLPDDLEEEMEAANGHAVPVDRGGRFEAVTLLWPEGVARPHSWRLPAETEPRAEADPAHDRFANVIAGLID